MSDAAPDRKPPTRRRRKLEQRARDRKLADAQRAEYIRLKTIRDEEIAEDQAPAAQRGPAMTPAISARGRFRYAGIAEEGAPLVWDETAPAVPSRAVDASSLAEPDTKRGGYRRANPLYAMNRRGKGRTVTHDHLKAAERLRTDYETGIMGAASPRSGLTGGQGGQAGDEEFVWLAAAERYRNAVAAISHSLRGVVEAIVIAGQAVPWIARAIGQSDETAVGLIVAGLDSLADHYWPQRDTRAKLMERALAELKPLGFDFAVSAIGEVIPQERIGRGRQITA